MVDNRYRIADFKRTVDNFDICRVRILRFTVRLEPCNGAVQQLAGRLRVVLIKSFYIGYLAGIKSLVGVNGTQKLVTFSRNETVFVILQISKIDVSSILRISLTVFGLDSSAYPT